jgi:hypothetical protein
MRIDRLRLDTGNDIGLDRDGRQQIATPDRRLFELVLDARHLAQRDRLAIVQCDLQVSQRLQRLALLVG